MNTKQVNIFMVDDHPMMIEGYKSILSFNNLDVEINVTPAHDCKEAVEIIDKTTDIYEFDIVFLDLSLPPYQNIQSGEDLAYIIKKKFPVIKIVILTSHAESFLLYDLKKRIEPHGILVKSDFTAEELITAFENIIQGQKYESKTVKEGIEELLSERNNIFLDELNREIVIHLSKGILTKNLPQYF